MPMLEDIYSEAEQFRIPKKRIKELLAEWKKEHYMPPENLSGLIEGVCE